MHMCQGTFYNTTDNIAKVVCVGEAKKEAGKI